MKNVTFIIWAFVVLCAGCSSSTSVVQDEVSMTLIPQHFDLTLFIST